MRILLVNPPHPSIGSRIPREHLPPLGLLSVGGPLIDAGHKVQLLDAELGPLSPRQIVKQATSYAPEAILIGHSGSTSGHPIVAEITRLLRRALAKTWIIYGGVFPTYHWREFLTDEPQINFIVRGEGEETTLRLIHALETGEFFPTIPGIAYWYAGRPFATPPAPLIRDLDAYRLGWELIDPHRWTSYFRLAAKRKVIQTDVAKWDYKHQVLATRNVPPWRVFLWVKLIEAVMQLRPRSLWRLFAHRDRGIRAAMRWYYRIGRKVWFHEIWNFLFRDHPKKDGLTLENFWGEPQDGEQYAMDRNYKRDDFIYPVWQQILQDEQMRQP